MNAQQAHLAPDSSPELSVELVISVLKNFSSCQGILEGFSLIFVHADLYSKLQIYILKILLYFYTAFTFIF